tara:strand:+ start:271 stop:432 length:162 start_codon:yes stop_codon:yes gene_type:complete
MIKRYYLRPAACAFMVIPPAACGPALEETTCERRLFAGTRRKKARAEARAWSR